MSSRYQPRPISEHAKQVAFSSDLDAMHAFVDAPIEPAITPLDRRFVLAYIQRHYMDALRPDRVIEVTRDALYTYDQARPHLLMCLAEAYEMVGDLEESEYLIEDLLRSLNPEDPALLVHAQSALGLYHYRVGAYRLAVEHCDQALAVEPVPSPYFALAAANALRALAHLDDLTRETELRTRYDAELSRFRSEGSFESSHVAPMRVVMGLSELLVAARQGSASDVEALLERLEERLGDLRIPAQRLRKRTLEAATWAWTWIGDEDRLRAAFESYREFLERYEVPFDRAFLVAAEARRCLGIDLASAGEVERVRHPAILFRASGLMQEAHPESNEFDAVRVAARESLPERLRKHVG